MTYETILTERVGHVLKITLNRPERLNEIGRASCRERVLVQV